MRKENFKTSHLLHLSTIADFKIRDQPWVKFQSAGWVNIQSAPTRPPQAAPYLLNVSLPGMGDGLVEHHCSVSIGVAVFINHEVSQSDILKRADAAMYQAKEAGRNTIRFYELNDGC